MNNGMNKKDGKKRPKNPKGAPPKSRYNTKAQHSRTEDALQESQELLVRLCRALENENKKLKKELQKNKNRVNLELVVKQLSDDLERSNKRIKELENEK